MFNNLFTPKNKKTDRELFLAIEIHESLIKTAVWQIEDEKPSIVSLGSYELWDSEDSLINGTDASLTEAIKGLDSQPDRVILGLPESWLVDNNVHPTKQKIIKRLRDELSIKPIGVVTITEAVIRHLKDQEGIPPTAILLEIYPSKVIVTLVNKGEKQAIEEVGRSDDLARDVEEGLARFDAEKLPARFILTNGSNLSDEEQQIISYPWTEKLPFIHIPKVQVLPIDFTIRSIALSGGAEAAKSLGIEIAQDEQQFPAESIKNVVSEDIAADFTSIGFNVENTTEEPSEMVSDNGLVEKELVPEIVIEPKLEPEKNLFSKIPKFNFPKISLPKPKLSIDGLPSRILLFSPILLIVIFVFSVVIFYFYFGRVKVTLTVSPTRLDKVIDMAIGANPVTDLLTVPAEKKIISSRLSDSLSTTGEAVVGEKAKGKIAIYTTGQMNLKVGTKIYFTNGNLAFVLDSEAVLASSSASTCSLISPCTVSVNVTASKIGAEYNLEKDSQFSVENYPKTTMLARSDTAFTGGSSRAVKAVSKEDQEKLLANVSEKIKADIDDQLKRADPDNRSLAISPLKYSTKSFDHSVGEEASTLSLDLAADLEVMVYSRRQLLSQVENKIIQGSSPGQVLAAEHTQVSLADPIQGRDNTFTTKASVSVVLLPELSEEKLAQESKGKPVSFLRETLQKVDGFKSASIEIYPNIPILNTFLPLNTKDLIFNVVAL